jgi:hypothetical protein
MPENNIPSNQTIAYTAQDSAGLSNHVFIQNIVNNELQSAIRIEKPYSSQLPYMVFNQQKRAIELFGDLYSTINTNQKIN